MILYIYTEIIILFWVFEYVPSARTKEHVHGVRASFMSRDAQGSLSRGRSIILRVLEEVRACLGCSNMLGVFEDDPGV